MYNVDDFYVYTHIELPLSPPPFFLLTLFLSISFTWRSPTRKLTISFAGGPQAVNSAINSQGIVIWEVHEGESLGPPPLYETLSLSLYIMVYRCLHALTTNC